MSARRPTNTAVRLRRLLAILTWLAQVGEASIDEAAARFDLTPEMLVAELELAACCGLPPYTPDQLMEIVVTDTTVSARLGKALARPRRLSPHEGFVLAASARALLAVAGSDVDGALARALAKLDRALGGERVVVELDAPPMLPVVREAVASGQRLAIGYYSASSDRITEREIVPHRVFASEGHWYVDAMCLLAGGERRFRVDRIGSATRVEGSAPAPAGEVERPAGRGVGRGVGRGGKTSTGGAHGFEAFVPGPDTRQVRLSLDPSVEWMVETIPGAGPTELVDGRIELDVMVGGDAWLERLLLRLGPAATVVHPVEDRSLASEAATRILARYGTIGRGE